MSEQIDNVKQNILPEQIENVKSEPENVEKIQVAGEPESVQDVNWRNFRQERSKERKEKEEAVARAMQKEAEAKALKEAMEALLNKPQVPSHNNDYEVEESEDDRIKKHIRIALEQERKRVEDERRAFEARDLPNRLSSNHKDFNQVCSEENLDYLEYHYPEVAAAFKNSPDNYEKWSNIYHAVKRFVPNGVTSQKDQARAQKNMNKPQSMSVGGVTATGDSAPKILTDQIRQDNWKRMQRVMHSGI